MITTDSNFPELDDVQNVAYSDLHIRVARILGNFYPSFFILDKCKLKGINYEL